MTMRNPPIEVKPRLPVAAHPWALAPALLTTCGLLAALAAQAAPFANGGGTGTAKPAAEAASLPKGASTGFFLGSPVTASWGNSGVEMTASYISNQNPLGTVPPPLRLKLVASLTYPPNFDQFVGPAAVSLGPDYHLATLNAGSQVINVDSGVLQPYTPPAPGCYFVTVALFTNFGNPNANYLADRITLNSGGGPDPGGSGFDLFPFGVSASACGAPSTATLTVTVSGSGAVLSTDGQINCPGICSAQYASGAGVTLNEFPAVGWSFAGWSGACSGTGHCSVTMNANKSATVSFTQHTGLCVPGASTLCIDLTPGDERFEVKLHFSSPSRQLAGDAAAVVLANSGISEGGAFSFFDPANPELLIKILDGCGLGGHYWVFFAAVTDVGFTVTVRDTVTEAVRTYSNIDHHVASPVQDTIAFTCP
jgi:hypothetical protein